MSSTSDFIANLLNQGRRLTTPNATVRLLKKKPVGYETKLILTTDFFLSKNKDGVYFCWFVCTDAFAAVEDLCSQFTIENSGTSYDNKIFNLLDNQIKPLARTYAAFPLAESGEDWNPA